MDRKKIEDLFQRVVSLPPDQHGAYLAAHCGNEADRAKVEKLLRHHAAGALDLTADIESSSSDDAGRVPKVSVATPKADPAERPAGSIVGHYELAQLLGRGGMGEVYLATDRRLERKIALKFLNSALAADADQRRRFLAEARAASALNHPNVCVIHEVGEADDGCPFMALELLDGESLEQMIAGSQLTTHRIADFAIQIVDALDAAHSAGIIHRDIKPSNINIGTRGQLKVLDFGLAKRIEDGAGIESSAMTHPGTILGTPLYMSPEQALGQRIDARSDLFSVGVVLYELVTGRRPFEGSSFAEVSSKIVNSRPDAMARYNYETPQELERIILKCLEKNPEERFSSARDLLVDLRRLMRDITSSTGEQASSSMPPAAPGSGIPAAPELALPALEDLEDSDIFISYASVDDQSMTPEAKGWISQFHRNLEVRIEQLSGDRVKIWRYPGPAETQTLDPQLLENLHQAKTLVSIVSPPYLRSKTCCQQVESFWDSAEQEGNLRLPSGSRVFKVVKRPIDQGDVPPRMSEIFSQLLDFDFFDLDQSSGRVREFDDSFGEDLIQLYHERIYDLAREISSVLREFRDTGGTRIVAHDQLTVYLASTTSELEGKRDRLRRELIARGHVVFPDKPLPLVADELSKVVKRYLEQCDVSIHPVGGMYGVVPEGVNKSILEVQNSLASEIAAVDSLRRFIWIPGDIEVRDARQSNWIDSLRIDPVEQRGAEVIEGSLETLRDVLLDSLKRKKESANGSQREAESPPRLYLICDPADETAVEPLEDFFYEQGIEVTLPAFDGDEADAQGIHIQNLKDADAVLVYYGAAGKHWVDFNVRDLAKAAGYRDQGPLELTAVYVAPPVDRRKERYKSLSTEVIRQTASFDPGSLAEFVARIREVRR